MKSLIILSLFLSALSGGAASAGDRPAPCIPLNAALALCTHVEGVRVSLVDAAPTAVLGIARVGDRDGLKYVFHISWNVEASLQAYADDQAREAVRERAPGLTLRTPVQTVVEGFPAIRYDLLAAEGAERPAPAELFLFIDTGAGIALFHGRAPSAAVTADALYAGARRAARILHTSK